MQKMILLAFLAVSAASAGSSDVSWCVDNRVLKLGIVSLPPDRLAAAALDLSRPPPQLTQIYAGQGLQCSSFRGLQILHPEPTYAVLRTLVPAPPHFDDVARLSYLGDSIVLDRMAEGKTEHKVIHGDADVLELGVRPDALIIHANVIDHPWGPAAGKLVVFVKSSGELSSDFGAQLFRAVEARLGTEPSTVYIRNDVYFVERDFPLRYFFSAAEMPTPEHQKGTATLICGRVRDAVQCAIDRE